MKEENTVILKIKHKRSLEYRIKQVAGRTDGYYEDNKIQETKTTKVTFTLQQVMELVQLGFIESNWEKFYLNSYRLTLECDEPTAEIYMEAAYQWEKERVEREAKKMATVVT